MTILLFTWELLAVAADTGPENPWLVCPVAKHTDGEKVGGGEGSGQHTSYTNICPVALTTANMSPVFSSLYEWAVWLASAKRELCAHWTCTSLAPCSAGLDALQIYMRDPH